MRDILFRGKRKDTGEWVYGYYAHIPCGRFQKDEHLIQTTKDNGTIGTLYAVDPVTVGQYTGLTDKNGTKIFEGDILLFDFEDIGKQKAVVEWCQKYATFQMRPLDDFKYAEMPKGTIIGNIHDTPEFLEAKE